MNRELLRILALAADATGPADQRRPLPPGTARAVARAIDGATTTAEAAAAGRHRPAGFHPRPPRPRTTRRTRPPPRPRALVARAPAALRGRALPCRFTAPPAGRRPLPARRPGRRLGRRPGGAGAIGATEGAGCSWRRRQPPDQIVSRGRAFDATELALISVMGSPKRPPAPPLARNPNLFAPGDPLEPMTAISTAKARTRVGALPPVTPSACPSRAAPRSSPAPSSTRRQRLRHQRHASTTGWGWASPSRPTGNSAGADGAIFRRLRAGCWAFANSSAGDAITIAEVGKTACVRRQQHRRQDGRHRYPSRGRQDLLRRGRWDHRRPGRPLS